MIDIALLSGKFGLMTALLCVSVGLAWKLILGAVAQIGDKSHVSKILDNALIYANILVITIHPAIITVVLFGLWDMTLFDVDYLSSINSNELGIVFIASILFIPFTVIYMRGLEVDESYYLWKKSYTHFGLPRTKTFFLLVLFPVALEIMPYFLFLSIAVEGIVFVPYLHQGTQSATVGKIIYSAITSERASESLAEVLVLLIILKAILFALIAWAVTKYKRKIINEVTNTIRAEPQSNPLQVSPSKNMFLPVLYVCFFLLFIPLLSSAIFILCKLLSSALVLLNSKGVSGVYSVLIEDSINSTSIIGASSNTLTVTLSSALIVILLYFSLSFVVGRKDIWEVGCHTKSLVEGASVLAVIPVSIYCYFGASLFYTNPLISIMFFLILYGLLYSIFSTRYGIINRIYGLEKKRISLSIKPILYWKLFVRLLMVELGILFLWIFTLLWNDIVVQLFAQTQFNGLTNLLMAMGKDGLSADQAGAVAIVQLAFLLVIFPLMAKIVHHRF